MGYVFEGERVPSETELKNREAVFSKAVESGINYLDITTPAEAVVYGKVMKNLGESMYVGYADYRLGFGAEGRRHAGAVLEEIDEGLRRLKVDCIDLLREITVSAGFLSDDEIELIIEAFQTARDQGKVRFLGFSSHRRDFLFHLLEHYSEAIDAVLFPFPFGARMDPKNSLFSLTNKTKVGAICIKPFHGCSLFESKLKSAPIQHLTSDALAQLALRSAMDTPEMNCVLAGMSDLDELENAVQCVPRCPLNPQEREWIESIGSQEFESMLTKDTAWLKEWRLV